MKLEKKVGSKIKGGVCALLIGLNVANGVQLNANPAYDKPRVRYDFSEFFSFQQQNTLEDLICYTISKYSPLIQTAKKIYPDYTLQELMDDSYFWDKLRFEWLTKVSYSGNLSKLNYPIVGEITMKGDYLKFSVFDKWGEDYLDIAINVAANPKFVKVEEIEEFLESNRISLTLQDKQGDFIYSIMRSEKK